MHQRKRGKKIQCAAEKLGDFKKRNYKPTDIVTLERPTGEVVLSFKGGFKV